MTEHVRSKARSDKDLLEWAWTIIANAGGGNWELETPEWQDAAKRWRDQYHAPRETDVKRKQI